MKAALLGHRTFMGGAGCFRSVAPPMPRLSLVPSVPRFVICDRQAEMLPVIIMEKHRAKLARNGEDIC